MKELSKLPEEVRTQVEKVVFVDLICENPYKIGCLEQMKGYPGKYKIRIGQYRIGITVNKEKKLIVCSRIAHRKDIYRLFP